jgi:small subunit ribosomal protein S20
LHVRAQKSHCRSCHAHTAAAPRPSVTAASSKMTIQAKQNSLKREKTAERNRMYNKSRKSEITTRMKKVFVALEGFKASPPASEADLAPVQVLINEAFQVIDKAVVKGILHRNTADRRKARLSKARQIVLVESGLYKP